MDSLFFPGIALTPFFSEQSVNFYGAEPTQLLDTEEANKIMINSWVANKTNNQITKLVDSVSPQTQLILLNAVSFKGQCAFACKVGFLMSRQLSNKVENACIRTVEDSV